MASKNCKMSDNGKDFDMVDDMGETYDSDSEVDDTDDEAAATEEKGNSMMEIDVKYARDRSKNINIQQEAAMKIADNVNDILNHFDGRNSPYKAAIVGALFKGLKGDEIQSIIGNNMNRNTIMNNRLAFQKNPFSQDVFTRRRIKGQSRNRVPLAEQAITLNHMLTCRKPDLTIVSGSTASMKSGQMPVQIREYYYTVYEHYVHEYANIYSKLCAINSAVKWNDKPRCFKTFLRRILKSLRLHHISHPHDCPTCTDYGAAVQELRVITEDECLSDEKKESLSVPVNVRIEKGLYILDVIDIQTVYTVSFNIHQSVLPFTVFIHIGKQHNVKNRIQRQWDMTWSDMEGRLHTDLKIHIDYGSYHETFGMGNRCHLNVLACVLNSTGLAEPQFVDLLTRKDHSHFSTTAALIFLFTQTDHIIDQKTGKSKYKRIWFVSDNGIQSTEVQFTLAKLVLDYPEIEWMSTVCYCAHHGYSRADQHIAVFKKEALHHLQIGDYPLTLEGVVKMFGNLSRTDAYSIEKLNDPSYFEKRWYPFPLKKMLNRIDGIRDCGQMIVRATNLLPKYDIGWNLLNEKRNVPALCMVATALVDVLDVWNFEWFKCGLQKGFRYCGLYFYNLVKTPHCCTVCTVASCELTKTDIHGIRPCFKNQ